MSFTINDSFIGYPPNKKIFFSGSDTKENYEEKLKSIGDNWYYKDIIIEYNYNNLGHRCKNLTDLNLKDYILFVGCSHTEGIGLELENTYPFLTAKKLNIEYYNLSLGGSGIDIIYHNLFVWFNKILQKPKHLIVQIPEPTRFLLKNNNRVYTNGITNNSDKRIPEFIITADMLNFWQSRYEMFITALKSLNVPFTEIHIHKFSKDTDALDFIYLDDARDKHHGIKSHLHNAEQLTQKIIKGL